MTLDLAALDRITTKAQKLHNIARDLQPFLGKFVRAKLLKPYYVNSDQRRFWLSEVMKIPRKKPWTFKTGYKKSSS